jgi:hypothetical protein
VYHRHEKNVHWRRKEKGMTQLQLKFSQVHHSVWLWNLDHLHSARWMSDHASAFTELVRRHSTQGNCTS